MNLRVLKTSFVFENGTGIIELKSSQGIQGIFLQHACFLSQLQHHCNFQEKNPKQTVGMQQVQRWLYDNQNTFILWMGLSSTVSNDIITEIFCVTPWLMLSSLNCL